MSEWIGTKEAMRILGVGSTTIKRWTKEKRLPFIRTAGGHRRFRRSAVEALQRDRQMQPDEASVVNLWARWLRKRDTAFVCQQIDGLHKREGDWFSVADFLGRVSTEIGHCWADGQFSVVDEHIATEKLVRAVTAVSSRFSVPGTRPTCLLATPSGERHSLGLVLTLLCLRSVGLHDVWVGVDAPVADLVSHILDSNNQLRIVALSASSWMTDSVSLHRTHRDIAAACRSRGIDIMLGGEGAWPQTVDYGHRCYSFRDFERALIAIGFVTNFSE